ncbi:Crp/Fnr family transcriptional regulator, partial [Methylobacterium sp. J-030]|nr:Crp/Fnr family transcriptional regulator [Methylobacterium sp. J-030]
ESLHALTARYPTIAAALWRDTLIDAATFREWLIAMGRRPAFEPFTHLFCELYPKQEAAGLAGDHRCPLPNTQVDFGSATAMTGVLLNRVIKDMCGRGLTTLHRPSSAVKPRH